MCRLLDCYHQLDDDWLRNHVLLLKILRNSIRSSKAEDNSNCQKNVIVSEGLSMPHWPPSRKNVMYHPFYNTLVLL